MTRRNSLLIKKLDYYVGIPLIFLAGLFKKKRPRPQVLQRVGVLITAALGDTTLLTPILQDIKKEYPNVHLIVFSGESNAPLLPHLPSVDETVVLPVKSPFKALKRLRTYPLDLLIDAGSWPRINSLLTICSRARWTIGFKTPSQGRHFGYDLAIPHRKDLHEVDNYRNLLAPLQIPLYHSPKLLLTHHFPMTSPFVVFHLFAASYKPELREWPFEYWKELVRESPYPIYLTGSRQDAEKNEAFIAFCAFPSHLFNLAGKTSLAESLSVFAKAKYVVSINTGVMHMAAAVGARVIGLNGPAPASRWGVIGSSCTNLSPQIEGAGFLHLGFEFKGERTDCMKYLSISQVLEAITLHT